MAELSRSNGLSGAARRNPTAEHPPMVTSSVIPLLARFGLAAIFLLSGFSKLTNPAATIGYISSVGLPLPELGYAVALLVELVGGALLVIGYRTRWVAAALALFTLAAAVFFHSNLADQNEFFHFFKNVAIAGGLLQVVATGAGRFSVDGRG